MAAMTTSTTPTRLEVSYSTAFGYTNLSASISSPTTVASQIKFYQTTELTFLWILFVFIVVGNGCVLIALLLSKGHKSRMNFFIKHLAAADLCVGLISVLTEAIWKTTISFEAGLAVCKVVRYLQCVVTYSSTYVLVALSIDRCDAITHPMNFSGSWKRARILVATAWLLSAIFSLPPLFLMELKEAIKDGINYGTQCWNPMELWQWQIYMSLVSLACFFIPTILISACYIIIVVTIWKKGKAMQTTAAAAAAASNTTTSGTTGGLPVEQEPESRRASSRGLIPKAKVKTVKMTFVIIFVFILCWSPYMIFDLLQVFELLGPKGVDPAIATFIQSFAHLNSAANPLIYCLFSTNIGATLCGVIRCRKKQEILPTGLTTSGTHSTSQSATRSSAYPTTTTMQKAAAATMQLVPSVPTTTTTSTTTKSAAAPRPSVTFRTAANIEV